ncbi:malonic semialdehyde reductase [Microvirga flavescens]|uniref:malonic semialdehyde reductase n=1 Tax=Microvirga flavescens TaxID=2249811 RepID=UPI000DDA3EE8|nr:malonic semialdehyde reductase [Microvirga flavescens]
MNQLDDAALNQLFFNARTLRHWQDELVGEDLLRAVADMAKLGPTSGNCCPARFVFVVTPEAKERLKPHLDEGNVRQTMSAPATVIVGYDLEFYEKFPLLAPWADVDSWRSAPAERVKEEALRNSSLQGAYLILAARAFGLDCGPMSGFDADGVTEAFFPDGTVRANFLINLGYGDRSHLRPRGPRLAFEDFCWIV